MVREGDEKKKKGWFGRRKGSSTQPQQQSVSRPPTAASYATPKKTGTSTSPTSTSTPNVTAAGATTTEADDDDLPPRMSTPKPRTSTSSDIASGSGGATPTTPEDAAVAHLPKHAGFDLEAMRKIIGQAQENPSELGVSDKVAPVAPAGVNTITDNVRSGSLSPSFRPPIRGFEEQQRSVSAPIPTKVPGVSEDERKDLAKEFARSFSMKEVDEPSGHSPRVRGLSPPSSSSSYGFQVPSTAGAPTLTFGDAFGTPVWGSTSPTPVNMTNPGSYGPSYRSPTFGASSISALTSNSTGAGMGGLQNPFATPSHRSLSLGEHGNSNGAGSGFGGGDTGLSFGAADGTITNVNGAGFGGADPWAVPGNIGKKSSSSSAGFGTNPWS